MALALLASVAGERREVELASASSTSRRWSSAVSVLRVTFSVARTVRSATSLRISWIARRVSASMSRRACAMQLLALGAALLRGLAPRGSRPPCARGRRSPRPAARASLRRSRYSSSSSSASLRVRSAVSIESSIALLALVERLGDRAGTRTSRSSRSETPKTTSVQIISPTPGVTRKLPPPSSAAASVVAGRHRPRGRTRSGPPRGRRRSTPRSARSRATG